MPRHRGLGDHAGGRVPPGLVDIIARLLGPQAWLLEDDRFGVVYQDARPGERSGYSRIGWHTDEQSGPKLRMWPSVAFTIHIDATSPRNGFLRIVPGSHLGGTDEMPLGFEHVPGEIALYCRARRRAAPPFPACGTARPAPPTTATARSVVTCGARWYGGERLAPNHGLDDFVKNARR